MPVNVVLSKLVNNICMKLLLNLKIEFKLVRISNEQFLSTVLVVPIIHLMYFKDSQSYRYIIQNEKII